MIKSDRPHKVTKLFQRLGIWSIPLLSTPLLLSLVLAQTLSPSVHKANTSNTSSSNSSANVSTVSQWEPLVQQDLNKSNSLAKQTNKLKTSAKTAQKPSVKANKHIATKKRRKHKKIATKAQYKPPAFEIRVAIANGVDSLTIGSSTEAYIMGNDGKVLRSLPAAQAFNAIPNSSNIIIGNEQLPNAVWIYPTKGGAVYVGDRWYRGKLLLVSQENKLLAVNNVNLEQYLSSVVGSEMHPTAPMEALKAQAIAARSYALVHLVRPASSWYNLGNTERWQVYKGMNSEYNTSHEAVKQTAGQFLSYKGGVVESLYAATDEIVAQAHGGMGMSQTGAYKLAAQGMNYTQILGYYYPGVQTARLPSQR